MKTIGGGKAAGIAKWAWEDPASRVGQAIAEVDDLARAASGPELAEIQDTGTMLSRLAGTLTTDPEPAMAMAGIASQFLDLAGWKDAYKHEARGRHGEWIGTGDATGDALARRAVKNQRMANERRQALDEQKTARQLSDQAAQANISTQNKAASVAAVAKSLTSIPLLPGETQSMHMNPLPSETPDVNLLHEQIIHQHLAPIMEAKGAEVLKSAQAEIARAEARIRTAADTQDAHKAVLKAANEGGIAIAGAIITFATAGAGLPILLAIAAGTGPILIQIIIEFFKRL
jgi:hypothetical protein